MLNHPHAPLGLGSKFKKAVAEVATVELFCFLCHRKANNYAYTFVAGCMQQFLILFKLLQLPLSIPFNDFGRWLVCVTVKGVGVPQVM